MLKKISAGLMAIVLSLTVCSCANDETQVKKTAEFDPGEPVTICFDLDGSLDGRHYSMGESFELKFTGTKARESAVKKILEDIKAQGGPANVSVEFIEGQGEEREGALTRLRAELMAGEGPDVFLISHKQYTNSNLFKFVEKKMEDNIFLPLDGYMEQAEFMDKSRMHPAVLNAGKNTKGQQVLIPLRYIFPTAIFPAADVELGLSQSYALGDMIDGSNPALTAALASWRGEESILANLSSAFGRKADYKKESLTFTQEEFRDVIHQLLDFYEKLDKDYFGDLQNGVAQADLWHYQLAISHKKWKNQPVTFIPFFNRQGGFTAKICDFIAVNGNSKNPAGAFWVVDYISGEQQFQSSDLHMYLNSHGHPIYDELMQEATMLPYRKDSGAQTDIGDYIYFENRDWQAFTSARDQIDSADFPSELDVELDMLFYKLEEAGDSSEQDKIIDDCYKNMMMLIGES